MKCGLLGESLKHSYSPQIHMQLRDYSYELFERSPQDLPGFLKSDSFDGINVTIPYKKAVIPFCDALSAEAATLGAVNTIVKERDGSLTGHNTDYYGFRSMAEKTGYDFRSKKVLVLGSGGASNTVVAVMKELGAVPIVISRTGQNNYHNLERHWDASVIVNTTPVGTYPNTDNAPIDITPFTKLECVMDLIYNPSQTRLLAAAQKRNLITENGLWMLVAQAKKSAELFTKTSIDDSVIASIYRKLKKNMQNIVLIGMPGSGKSTVGKLLADKLGRAFFDSDDEIERVANMSIPKIFEDYGQAVFRAKETAALQSLCKQSGSVIATGGGCVTIAENYDILKQNGIVIWLQRDIQSLPTDGRPLSINSDLSQMYEIRKPLYEKFTDIIVVNLSTPEATVQQIIEKLEMEVTL